MSDTERADVTPPPAWKTEMKEMLSDMFTDVKNELAQQLEEQFVGQPEYDDIEVAEGSEILCDASALMADYLGNTAKSPSTSKSGFEDLTDEFSTADKTGPATNVKLAGMVEELVKGKLPKTKLEELFTKYPRPENCTVLVSPKVNRAIWNQLKQSSKASDKAMQKAQQCFVSSMYAMIAACEKATDELKPVLTHALVLALAGNRESNLRCRELLRPELNSQFAALCSPATPITHELFGDELSKEIDDMSKANKLSGKLASTRRGRGKNQYQPYNVRHNRSYSSTQTSSGRDGKFYPPFSKPFLGGRNSYRQRGGMKQTAPQANRGSHT